MTASDEGGSAHVPASDDAQSPAVGAVEHGTVDVDGIVSNVGSKTVKRVTSPDDGVAVTKLHFVNATNSDLSGAVETWKSLSAHRHVVGLVDWDGADRLVTERMDGGSLADRLADDDDGIWPDEAVWITERLCEAVEHAHDEGALHTSIGPETVQFRAATDGCWDLPKLGGWGVTRKVRADPDAVADLDGCYAPPEQLASDRFGEPDERTEVYRLGAVCYALLAGRAPVTGTGYEVLQAKLSGAELAPVSEETAIVPAELDEVVLKALESDPADRYDSVVDFRAALEAVTLPAGATTAAMTGEYRQYAGGPANRSLAGSPLNGDDAVAEAWTARSGESIDSAPAVAYGTVYVGGESGTLWALHADTGEERWAVSLEDCADDPADSYGDPYAVEAPPAVGDTTVCVGTGSGLFAFDAVDGEKQWERAFDVTGAVTVDDGLAYVATRDETLCALDIESGATEWETELDGGVSSSEATAPAVADGTVTLNTGDGVATFEAATGEHRWTFPISFARPPSIAGGQVYAGDEDTIYAVDLASGDSAWRADIEYEIAGPPAVDDAAVYVTVQDDWGGVEAFDPESGARQWTYSLEEREQTRLPRANAVVADDAVVLVLESILSSDDQTEEVVVLGAADGHERLSYGIDQREHTAPAVADDRLICANTEFDVIALSLPADPEDQTADGNRKAADGTESADTVDSPAFNWNDAKQVCDVLRAQTMDEIEEDRLPDKLGWNEARTTAVVDGMQSRGIVEVDSWDDVGLLEEPDWSQRLSDDDLPKIDWNDAKQVCDVLKNEVNNELDKDWLPDELGWTEERTRSVVDDLLAHDYVEINDWDEVVLLREPSRDSGNKTDPDGSDSGTQSDDGRADTTDTEVTSDDAQTLLDLIEDQEDSRLVQDIVKFETGWSAAKVDAVIDELTAAGQVATNQIGGSTFLTIDKTGVVGGIDTAAGQARPDADALAEKMADPELAGALAAAVENANPDGTVELLDAMDDLPDNEQWGLLVANGYLVQSGDAFRISLPDGVEFEFAG
ncbi:PQQ-binding-like beta-propeller repeat protein [Halovenus rubra]|uniref:PQQ-binding-like beta-propeller repeat protein n=2 Tax=Halovenus rubra TaxID=869890 RepID=A0ACC7DZ11_9EURY|nr:PQQ-binding-like beta-propeller repeat protein [Halovenus rubra]